MKLRRLLSVTRTNLARDRRGLVLSSIGVALGIAALVFFVSLGRGVGTVVRERIFPVDARLVHVVPPKVSLGAFLGGGRLDDHAVTRLRALPGVAHAYRILSLAVPAVTRYDGNFFGRPLRMGLEIVAIGVDPGYVAADVAKGRRFEDPGEGKGPVPALIARRLLEIYDRSFAAARGLPTVSASMVSGFRFPLTLGASYVTATHTGRAPARETLQIVGVSDRALLGGVTLPLATVRRWNRLFGAPDGGYREVVIEGRTPADVPSIAAAVRKMGFSIDTSERRLAEQAGAAVSLTTLALSLLSLLILALAAVSIARAAYAEVASRTRELGLLRAIGARRRDVRAMVVAESLAAGLLGGLVGIGLAWLGTTITDLAAARLLPPFPFKPDTFFVYDPWLLPAALVAALVASGLGALLPAAFAARLDPARALSGG